MNFDSGPLNTVAGQAASLLKIRVFSDVVYLFNKRKAGAEPAFRARWEKFIFADPQFRGTWALFLFRKPHSGNRYGFAAAKGNSLSVIAEFLL